MYWTALILGVTGSFHCALMCSPLAFVATSNGKAIRNRLVYNVGRIMTYGLLGLTLGGVVSFIPVAGLQKGMTTVLGIALVAAACTRSQNMNFTRLQKPFIRISAALRTMFSAVLNRRGLWATFLLGSLNGLLPCGLTVAALLIGLSLGPWESGAFMMVFGLGTLPAMLGFSSLLRYAAVRIRLPAARLVTIMLFVSGCLLISRGVWPPADPAQSAIQLDLKEGVLCR